MKIRRKHPVRVNHLGSDPIPQLVRRLALPAMLAQFVNVLYSIIDRMYIGNIANVGDIALAGVGICGPIVTMISAFAAWIGNGGAPLLSIKSGEQNKEGASVILANCFVLLIGMAVCLTIGAYLCKDALLVWFGACSNVWIRFGFSASFNSAAIAPVAFRSSAVTGFPSNVYATIIRPSRRFKSCISSARQRIAIISDATVMTK